MKSISELDLSCKKHKKELDKLTNKSWFLESAKGLEKSLLEQGSIETFDKVYFVLTYFT